MDDNVCAQVPAPRSQYSKQNSEHADHDHIFPTLIEMKQTKHYPLPQHSLYNAPGQGMKLPLYVAPKCHFLAHASSDRSSNPNQDFKNALGQQGIDGFRTTRPEQPVNGVSGALPQ